MDSQSLARQASTLGLMPFVCLKDALADSAVAPLLPSAMNTPTTISHPAFLRAMLYESALYLLRSISQLVAYEAAISREHYSWAAVTLYYANYYAALSMNRIAGEAISTTAVGRTYLVRLVGTPATFEVERTDRNNHKEVWLTNRRLYEPFNWRDSTFDGVVVRIPSTEHLYHPERKDREFINYHPEGYREMLGSASDRRWLRSRCRRYYTLAPNTLAALPISDDFEKTIATLECGVISRHILLMAIFEKVHSELINYQSSRVHLKEMFGLFSKNYFGIEPFTTAVLKSIYHNGFQKIC